jgi:hypothetical protein
VKGVVELFKGFVDLALRFELLGLFESVLRVDITHIYLIN